MLRAGDGDDGEEADGDAGRVFCAPFDQRQAEKHLFVRTTVRQSISSEPYASTHHAAFLERMFSVQMFDRTPADQYAVRMAPTISTRQRDILEFIEQQIRERGYPPSVREIGDAVGLTSPSTVHSHLNTLQRLGYLRRDPTKPRAIEVRYDVNSGAMMERRPVRHVPLVGDVAAGTDVLAEENVEELLPVPVDFTGDGELFMLRVRGDSMIEIGILDGDFVVATQIANPNNGDIVVAGIPGGEATIKTYSRSGAEVTLTPANSTMEPMQFTADEVEIYGKVVTVMRRY
jgi:repressor LexA